MINNKNKLLLISIVALLAASYYFAIRKTVLLKNKFDNLHSQTKELKKITKKLNILTQKNIYFDSILSKMDLHDTSEQNNLIRIINQEAKNNLVKVMDFNQPHIYENNQSTEYTYSFDLNGDFIDILKVINEIELKGNFGEIIHINYEKTKDYKTSRFNLNATVLLQQVK